MKTGIRGIELIKHFEGLKLDVYTCSGGVKTIGYGTTVYGDTKQKVKLGDTITKERAEELLRLDLVKFEGYVNKKVNVQLSQDQFDALVSIYYNCGPANINGSTLVRLLNQGDYPLAAAEFRNWRKSGGKVLKGLERRRKAEEKLFCGCVKYLD